MRSAEESVSTCERKADFISRAAFTVAAFLLASGASLVGHVTLDREDGALARVILAIPIVITTLPLLFRSRVALGAAVGLMTCWTLLGLASIGVFYIPATVALALAAVFSVRGSAKIEGDQGIPRGSKSPNV